MSRFTTVHVSTGTVADGVDYDFDMPAIAKCNIGKIKIIASGSTRGYRMQIYKKATRLSSELQFATNSPVIGDFYTPTDRNGNEVLQGFVLPYEDLDLAGNLHCRIHNFDAVARSYDVYIDYEGITSLSSSDLVVGEPLTAISTIQVLANVPVLNSEAIYLDGVRQRKYRAYQDAILARNPAGYWRLGEASGSVARDSGINVLDGSYWNAPTLNNAGLLSANPGKSALFSQSSSQFASVPNDAHLAFGDTFTLIFWLNYFSGGGSTRGLMDKGAGNFEVRLSGGVPQLLKDGSGVVAQANAGLTHSANHMMAITKTGADIHFYTDGVDVTDLASIVNQTMVNTSDALRIGAASIASSAYANGYMQEAAVFNYVLTPSDIAYLYKYGTDLAQYSISGQTITLRTSLTTANDMVADYVKS